jgi:hypothetical protein
MPTESESFDHAQSKVKTLPSFEAGQGLWEAIQSDLIARLDSEFPPSQSSN